MKIDVMNAQEMGDDYYMDDDGEWVKACEDCPYNDSTGDMWEED